MRTRTVLIVMLGLLLSPPVARCQKLKDIIPTAAVAPRPEMPAREPVPAIKLPPKAHPLNYGDPVVRGRIDGDVQTIVLSNDAVWVELRIEGKRRARIMSIRSASSRELLSEPVNCFSVVDSAGMVVKDGSKFAVDSWQPVMHGSFGEIEVRLSAPERVIWRLKLYRDKPYFEQVVEMPVDWRAPGSAVRQVLVMDPTLRPVMPNDVIGRGFKAGRPNLKGRHRFEYVTQSDHCLYDAAGPAGMSAFVAGVGGEERITRRRVELLDHVTAKLGSSEPIARFVLWPFDGPVENGFGGIRRFISDEYACAGDKSAAIEWTQFMIWQWIPRTPRKPTTRQTDPFFRKEVTADRLLDIMPDVAAMGFDTFHIDAGWETSFADNDWHFDPERFPNGFEPIRKKLRDYGMKYMCWWGMSKVADNPAEVLRLIDETDLSRLFHDRMVDENTVYSMREVRKKYPGFECFVHNTASRSKFYPVGNLHYVSDFDQVYVAEEEYLAWANIKPEPAPPGWKLPFTYNNLNAGDLITRNSAYEHQWAWPFKSTMQVSWPWVGMEGRTLRELSQRVYSLLGSRYIAWWAEDPRVLTPEQRNFFMDYVAFFKVTRPYFREYQHVLGVPDGYAIDGAAHIDKNGKGFIVLCNPAMKDAELTWKELFWEPELEIDPSVRTSVTDWTQFLSPKKIASVDLNDPKGVIKMAPLSFRVLGINIDLPTTLAEVKKQRALLHWTGK